MKSTVLMLVLLALMGAPAVLRAQKPLPDISGTWQVDTPDGPQNFIIRSDSSASFGEETVRWSLARDTIYILFGEEWVGYHFRLKGKKMTLSGGDLEEPVVLKRVGPAVDQPERPHGPLGGRPASSARSQNAPAPVITYYVE